MARHQGNHHGYTAAIKNALDKIDTSQSKEALLEEVSNLQKTAQKNMSAGMPIRGNDMWNKKIFGKDKYSIGNKRVFELWSKIL
ncbi:AHH domain-containing protein [Vibrio rotiferianus]|uniref:AHH domain-containing protein n=1 Tax=Vibrio rotiferianus TaxID=190895 RepID=UPI0033971DE3